MDYRRDERSGTRTQFGSFGSTSTQMLMPVDDATDRLDATLRYEGASWFAEAGYSGSLYDTKAASLRWDNPFNADGAGRRRRPDGARARTTSTTSSTPRPAGTACRGTPPSRSRSPPATGTQDTGFLPYTINPTIATDPLPARNLDGEMTVMRADLTVSSRPIDRLRLRGSVAWDERDNDTRQRTYTSVVHTDLFPVLDDRVNPVYGFERLRLAGSADYKVYDDLSVGVGRRVPRDRPQGHRPGGAQRVAASTAGAWCSTGPSGTWAFVLKGGAKEREPDRYDLGVATANGQNPLMRKYNMAYLYRSYGEMLVDVALGTLPLTLGASALLRRRQLQLLGARRRLGPRPALRRGPHLGGQREGVGVRQRRRRRRSTSRTRGSSVFGDPDWLSTVEDDFSTYGGGFRAQFADDIRLDLNYTHAKGDSDTTLEGVSAGSFPTVTSELDSLRADFSYGLTEKLDVTFTWWYERFDSSDWALAGHRARHDPHGPRARCRALGLQRELRGRVGALLLRFAQARAARVIPGRRAPLDGARQAAEQEQVRGHQRVPVQQARHARRVPVGRGTDARA